MLATKCANGLPTVGDDYDYYSSFESFRQLMQIEGERILQMYVENNFPVMHGIILVVTLALILELVCESA